MIEAIDISIYNHELRFFYSLIDSLKLLWSRPGNPKNVIFIAHVIKTEYTSLDKSVTTTRSIVTAGKKTATYIPTEFDNVWMFNFKEVGMPGTSDMHHICLTRTYGEDDAKNVLAIGPEIDFTNRDFYEEIQKQLRGVDLFK